uniref:A-kinase anchor 110kDa C-terminal domain-containing protein n=1 Tax=Laticauda laticaudata TaxID=8630 RepID=A0A8C5SK41_LATLA
MDTSTNKKVNVVSWLSNDLQKYAIGFKHALRPSGPRKSAYESPVIEKMSQGSDTSFRGSCSQRGDDLSYYVNKLCSLVVQMAHKEMKDKLESSGRCIRQSIKGSNGKNGEDYGKLSPKPSQDDPRKTSLFYGEMSNQSKQNGYNQGADRQMLERKQSAQDDGSCSKGLMVYANQVASDMMFSFMKTMKVQKGKHPPPACVVLKKVLLKHTRDVISDLIDSTMKNLHNVTGVLMTDSDFINTVKKNLFNAGTQKSTEILEAMVKRLFKALSGDDKKSQSLAFAALKAGAHCDSRSQGLHINVNTATSLRKKQRPGMPGVIVNNHNCNNSTQNRELQAVLQWLVASQFNVPNLTFMSEHNGELNRLPQLADKAVKKGYSVGDIVQEVMKYYEKQQMDAMSGCRPQCGLVEWLLCNL